MIEKSNEKRITLKEICLSKWFMKNYRTNFRTRSEVNSNTKSNQSLSDINVIKVKQSKFSFFKKNELFPFTNDSNCGLEEAHVNNEGITQINNYQINPKFFDNTSFDSSSFLNYAKGMEYSIGNSCFLLGAIFFLYLKN